MTDTVIFVTATGNWQVPRDWNILANKIECLGPGGKGAAGVTTTGSAAGGGGAYATKLNVALVPYAQIAVVVGTGDSETDTNFNSGEVIAKAGKNASGIVAGAGGDKAACTPASGAHSGGAGGSGDATVRGYAGASGGGAAGPSADGSAGGNCVGAGAAPIASLAGGNSGTGAAGGAGVANTGNPGAAGTGTWVSNPGAVSVGPGGGASGGGVTAGSAFQGAAIGGLYGGGGSAPSSSPANQGGSGRPGIIVITYTPATTPVYEAVNRTTNTNLKFRGRPHRKAVFIHGTSTMLRWRHLTSYFFYSPLPFTIKGPGTTDIRQKEPALTRLRTATLMRLRVINPSLEE